MMKVRRKSNLSSLSKVKAIGTSMFDGEIDKRKKWMVLGILLYIISPIDILPDVIPVVGYVDDMLVPILLFITEKLISTQQKKAS